MCTITTLTCFALLLLQNVLVQLRAVQLLFRVNEVLLQLGQLVVQLLHLTMAVHTHATLYNLDPNPNPNCTYP